MDDGVPGLAAVDEKKEAEASDPHDAMAAAMAVREYLTARNQAMAGPPEDTIKRIKKLLNEYSKTNRAMLRLIMSERVQAILEKWYAAPTDGDWTITLTPRERERERRRTAANLWQGDDHEHDIGSLRRIHSTQGDYRGKLQRANTKKFHRSKSMGKKQLTDSDEDDETKELLEMLEDQRQAMLSPATLFNTPTRSPVDDLPAPTP